MLVKATREGLVGLTTASGWVIDDVVRFCALPSTKALHRRVRITNPLNGRVVIAQVLDVGPWNEHDDAYVLQGARPLAEINVKVDRHGNETNGPTNGAGIDLGQAVWLALDMKGNTDVEWEFV